jgi:hypothetical protein
MKWLAMMAQQLLEAARKRMFPREKMQVTKRQTRFTYTDGPMLYLGQQIVKVMQDAGYPAKIFHHYRTAEQQNLLFAEGRTKARAWQSPHNFCEAVDIVHPSLFWEGVTDDYWDTLYACGKIVEERFGVDLEFGYDWGWDKAHIELKDWRKVRDMKRAHMRHTGHMAPPTPKELWHRFQEVLPAVARQAAKAKGFREPEE